VCIIQPSQIHIVKEKKEIKSRKKGIMLESAAFGKAAESDRLPVLASPRIRKMQVERQSLCREMKRVWS
jgi:hypothetical protein